MAKVAWKVEYEEGAEIVFRSITEKPVSEDELVRVFSEDAVDAERTPQYDQYADNGYVPPSVLIEDGWYFYCSECDSRIDEENEQEDENGEEYYPDPVIVGNSVYCCEDCLGAKRGRQQREKIDQEAAKVLVTQLMPWAEISIVSGGDRYPVVIEFTGEGATAQSAVEVERSR